MLKVIRKRERQKHCAMPIFYLLIIESDSSLWETCGGWRKYWAFSISYNI